MSTLPFPPELFALPPLAFAAGVDLYLTLLLIGAAPTLGLWEMPLPGALGDLDSPSVLIMVGLFYLAELVTERFPPVAVVWNAFHAIIRPLSGALLALLLLDGQSLVFLVVGTLAAGLLASIAHGVRSGAAVLRWLGAEVAPSDRLVSLAEDVAVVGLISLTLDAPGQACAITLVLLVAASPFTPSLLRAFAYAVQLIGGRVFVTFRQRRWRSGEELPVWVSAALDDDDPLAPGGVPRGSPAGVWRLPGAPRFVRGWVVVRGGVPVFVFRRRAGTARIELGAFEARDVHEGDLFRRIDLTAPRVRSFLLFGLGGPGVESLRSEFVTGSIREP